MVGLMDYMAQENASSLLQFWLIVTNLKEQISECDAKGKPVLSDEAAHKDAQALFNRFFAPNGRLPDTRLGASMCARPCQRDLERRVRCPAFPPLFGRRVLATVVDASWVLPARVFGQVPSPWASTISPAGKHTTTSARLAGRT